MGGGEAKAAIVRRASAKAIDAVRGAGRASVDGRAITSRIAATLGAAGAETPQRIAQPFV